MSNKKEYWNINLHKFYQFSKNLYRCTILISVEVKRKIFSTIFWMYKQLKFYIHQECIILSHKTGRTIFLVQRKTCFNGYIFCLSTQGMNKIWVCFCWDKLGFNDRVVIQKFAFCSLRQIIIICLGIIYTFLICIHTS